MVMLQEKLREDMDVIVQSPPEIWELFHSADISVIVARLTILLCCEAISQNEAGCSFTGLIWMRHYKSRSLDTRKSHLVHAQKSNRKLNERAFFNRPNTTAIK